MTMQTAAPFAEIADPAGDYELSIKLEFALNDYAEGIGSRPVREGWYLITGGRSNGVGRLVVSPIIGEDVNDAGELEDVYSEPVVETDGPDPLALLRTLLGAGTA